MAFEYRTVRRVEFSETDMAGIVHYSNFFRYMETAEHAFFRSLGFSVVTTQVDPPVGWPRVHAECDYFRPLLFEDEFEVWMLVKEKRSKSLTYLFRFHKLNGAERLEVARGTLAVVCVRRDASGKMAATRIPERLANCIETAPDALLAAPGRAG
jgi:acyl-CoA thioester hydrolase